MQHMQFQPARASIGLGPRETIAFERDRRRIEQPDQSFSLLPQPAGSNRDQRHGNIAKHDRRPRRIGVRQGRAARHPHVEVVKPTAVRGQPGNDLPQAGQPRHLGKQQGFQMPRAGPGVVAAPHAVIAIMRRHRASDGPTVQRFQQTLKCGSIIRHGRPQNPVCPTRFWPKM